MQSCLKNIKLEMLKGVYVPTNLHFRTIIQMKLFFSDDPISRKRTNEGWNRGLNTHRRTDYVCKPM
jgi:hypothetical protein